MPADSIVIGLQRLLRQPKIQDLHATVAQDKHVVGLQIAMDDALLVRGRKTFRHLNTKIDRFARRQRALLKTLPQALSFAIGAFATFSILLFAVTRLNPDR